MKPIKLLLPVIFLLISVDGYSQKLSLGGQFGYSAPTGDFFDGVGGEKLTSFGIFYNLDGLYHFDRQLAAGFTTEGNILFTSDDDDEIRAFVLLLLGVKGYYRFFESKISPFTTLTLGFTHLSASGDNNYRRKTDSSLGVQPEIGVEFGRLFLAASYLIPTEYETHNAKGNAGALQFSIGYRGFLD
jgi:hypothetical protein